MGYTPTAHFSNIVTSYQQQQEPHQHTSRGTLLSGDVHCGHDGRGAKIMTKHQHPAQPAVPLYEPREGKK